jgi:hypothetical protein
MAALLVDGGSAGWNSTPTASVRQAEAALLELGELDQFAAGEGEISHGWVQLFRRDF